MRRIAALPQAFVTTTTLDDLDPALRSVGTAWAVTRGDDGTPGSIASASGEPLTRPRPRSRRPGAARPTGSATCCPRPRAPLGLEDELRLARAIATWDAIVAERVPPAVGACRLVALEPDAIVVAADEPIVAAELRMRALELLGAFARGAGRRPRARLRCASSAGPGDGGSDAGSESRDPRV